MDDPTEYLAASERVTAVKVGALPESVFLSNSILDLRRMLCSTEERKVFLHCGVPLMFCLGYCISSDDDPTTGGRGVGGRSRSADLGGLGGVPCLTTDGTTGQMSFGGTGGPTDGLNGITGLGVSGRTGSPTGWRAILGVWMSFQIFVGRDDPCRNSSR